MDKLLGIANFGEIDAESDRLLERCFQVHPAYGEILDGARFLVIGRKGSGKTAIYRRLLMQDDPQTFTVGHSFLDYPWHHHVAQAVPDSAEHERYVHSWKYLILLSLAKVVLNLDQSQPWDDSAMDNLDKIEKFLVDTYGSRDPDVAEAFRPGRRLRGLAKLGVDLKILRLEVGLDEVEMQHLPPLFQDVNRTLEKLLISSLNPASRYFVCFDELDRGFDPTSDDYKERLIGLIMAARDLNRAAAELGKRLKVVVFLRDDIYLHSLQFEDKNKVTDTYAFQIEWDVDSRGGVGATLKTLMEKRFSDVLGETATWESIFDEGSPMRGHQSKYQHILDRTFLRPRDIIKFCNSVLNQYKARIRSGAVDPQLFCNDDVNASRLEYSTYFRQELIDELQKHLPDINIYFEIIRQVGYAYFERKDFEQAFEVWKHRLDRRLTPSDILEQLYNFSIVAFYRAGGREGGSEYVFKYLEPQSEYNRSSDKFRVHRGLIEALNIREYRRT